MGNAGDSNKRRKTGNHATPTPPRHSADPPGKKASRISKRKWTEAKNDDARTEKFVDMAYKGNYKGAIWNAQGLCTRCPKKHEKRWNRVFKLLRKNDFVMLSETHATEGKADAMTAILKNKGIHAFWSNGGSKRAGVCILVNQSFMNKFKAHEPVWGEIHKGEAAILQLQGSEGNLDLFTVYMPTGNAASTDQERKSLLLQRCNIRTKIADRIKSPHGALSIIGGDFNYVTGNRERWTLAKGDWSSTDNSADQKDFLEKMGPHSGMHELHQEHVTHRSGLAQSRLDRVYTNQHTAEQLDCSLGCAALEWDTEISHHRPVIFFRKRRSKEDKDRPAPIPTGPIQDPRWPERVRAKFLQLSSQDYNAHCPMRRLYILKDAIKNVTLQMEVEATRSIQKNPVTETDDQLGWTIRFIRAAEEDKQSVMERCCQAYPHLRTLFEGPASKVRQHGNLSKCKDHAVDLYRTQVLEDMHRAQAEEGSISDDITRNRKSKIQMKLQRLKPGSCNSIAAMLCADGKLITDAGDIARELHRHWHQVFQAKTMDSNMLKRWLQEELQGEQAFNPGMEDFDLTLADIEKSVKNAPATMPGPDGIPYLAWKRLGILGADCLFHATTALNKEDAGERLSYADAHSGDGNHNFNIGNMVFLPKKVAGCDPDLGDFYTANDTRPLVLVNTDNRIIAGAVRSKLEPILSKWISHMQHGFLSGRSMLANSVDIQHSAQMVALQNDMGGLVLFDFKAAFPSLNHRYMHTVLEALGLPAAILNLVKMMYHQHGCNILFDGQSFTGFDIDAGIRQGCPLSPLLFALVVDILLRRIQKHLPDCTVRAFADDIAVVVKDVQRDMPILRKIFHEFSQISNLDLNMPKCVLVPLWCDSLAAQKEFINEKLPDWCNITVADKGTYLGFDIGPSGHTSNWEKATRKFLQRSQEWADLGLGMSHAAAAYSIYVLPVLTFIAQLCDPPEAVYDAEKTAIANLLPGPYEWCTAEDAFHLETCYGQHRSFPSLKCTAEAAQRRVLQFENREHGGLRIATKTAEIRNATRLSQFAERKWKWKSWFEHSPATTLERNKERLDELGLDTATLLRKAGRSENPEERNAQTDRAVRNKFQRTTKLQLLMLSKPDHEARLRHKLASFHIQGNMRTTVIQCLGALRDLKILVPPRVSAAVLRTLFNGWTSDRRFQKSSHCKLGCQGFTDEDSIEHYSVCPTIVQFARSFLNLGVRDYTPGVGDFVTLGLNRGTVEESKLALKAILIYSVYRTSDLYRRKGATSQENATQALQQFAKDATRGHPKAQNALRFSFLHHRHDNFRGCNRHEDLLEHLEEE